MTDPVTLADGLQKELARNREALVAYREIGPNGAFAVIMIEAKIENTEKAMLEGDLPAMIACYKELQGTKL